MALTGCSLTIDHSLNVDHKNNPALKQTKPINVVDELTPCRSKALDMLLSMDKIDVAKYKSNKDTSGLLRASFSRLKERRMLIEFAKADIDRCYQKQH